MVRILAVALLALCLALVGAQIPCDDAYGKHCPEAAGFEVGECMKRLDAGELSEACQEFVRWHDACRQEIEQYCAGNSYTGDTLACLTEWNKDASLSEDCRAALPKKEAKKKEMTEQEKKKAAERRKARKAAEKMARSSQNEKQSKKKKSKKDL